MLETLAIANYRSLRDVLVPLRPLVVVTGHNGSGKSSLYRALRLLAATAQGSVVGALAREGGLSSTLWAGPENVSRRMRRGEVPVQGGPRKKPISLKLGFTTEDFGYAIDLGLPKPSNSRFGRDPEIKRECIWAGPVMRPSALLVDRRGAVVRARDGRAWSDVYQGMASFESMLTAVGDPRGAPEVLTLRERIRGWRFYDHFRTDAEAPARQAQLGTRTPVLAHDGSDLAAAWQTILEIGDATALAEAVDDAFEGSTVQVEDSDGRFSLSLRQPGLLRPLGAEELSDGTLRYLLWIAALLTPRPPELVVLNEPETSLHPSLIGPLARLIRRAALRTQVWVVSHDAALVDALGEGPDCARLELTKVLGATEIVDQAPLDRPPWAWPAR